MIKTGLPYSVENMSQIYDEGAVIDLSNLNFPPEVDTKDIIRTCLIYLRNTNFNNIQLDFNKCNKEFKFKFLYEYLFSDIVFENEQLLNDWFFILFLARGLLKDISNPDLTEEEAREFINLYESEIIEIFKFLNSIMIFILYKLDTNLINVTKLEHDDFDKFNENIYNFIKSNLYQAITAFSNEDSGKFFTHYFKQDNNALFDACAMTDYYNMVNTLFNESKDKVEDLIKAIDNFNQNNPME